jgi:replicative DNA helicase
MQTGVTVIALSQLNRESEQKEFPTLSSLRDSGSLEQDANVVLFLHQNQKQPNDELVDENKKELCLIIAKQRDGENNVFCRLNFYGKTQTFYKA